MKTLIDTGEEHEGVYHYTGKVVIQAGHVGKSNTRELWHRRLGHMCLKFLSSLANIWGFPNNTTKFEKSNCDICFGLNKL